MKKLVVFDLDGTLNQTRLYGVQAIRHALADLGVTHLTDEEICAQIGARPADYVKIYLPNGDEALHRKFLELESKYENELLPTCGKAFDGARGSMERLKKADYLTAVCSNASERYIRLVTQTIGVLDLVDEIQPLLPGLIKADTLRLLLERTSPDRAVMIGDRVYDKEAARENSLPFIGCAYGYNAPEISDADRVANHASELFELVQELIG